MPFTPQAIQPASTLHAGSKINILIYGREGTGKTTLASTIADVEGVENVLLVDIEKGGSKSVKDRDDILVYTPENWQDLIDLLKYLESPQNQYGAVILDSLTEMQRVCMDAILTKKNTQDAGPTGPDWQVATSLMSNLVRRYKALSQKKGLHVIYLALEMNPRDQETGELLGLIGPKMTRVTGETIREQVDFVTRLTNKGGARVLHLTPNGRGFYGKVRRPRGIKELPPALEDPTMPKLFKLLNEE